MNELCKGCRLHRMETDKFNCGFDERGAQSYCPCINCLVKVVCQKRCHKRLAEYPERMDKYLKEVGSDRYL
jgi:hypothetical protein